MDNETLEALRGSIAKWEGIVAGTHRDQGVADCPLCDLFYLKEPDCLGCPVMAATGHPRCRHTPYPAYCVAERRGLSTIEARQMLEFLKSLLPT